MRKSAPDVGGQVNVVIVMALEIVLTAEGEACVLSAKILLGDVEIAEEAVDVIIVTGEELTNIAYVHF